MWKQGGTTLLRNYPDVCRGPQETSVSTANVSAKTPDTAVSHMVTNIPEEKMEETDFPETLAATYETTWCHTWIFKLQGLALSNPYTITVYNIVCNPLLRLGHQQSYILDEVQDQG
jgi:hypothetical protein